MHIDLTPRDIERFWSKVRKTERCWLWTGAPAKTGYGTIAIGGRKGRAFFAHRVSWQLEYGDIPDGMHVLHDCDKFCLPGDVSYRLCVRPSDLFLGTQADNTADCIRKGRNAFGDRAGARTKIENVPRGVRHWNARLSEKEVLAIIAEARSSDHRSYQQIADFYHISIATAWNIANGRTWRHVADIAHKATG